MHSTVQETLRSNKDSSIAPPKMSIQKIDESNPILVVNASHNFFKTKLCPYFLQGICTKGSKCSFAHNKEEMRDQPNLKKN